MVARRRRSVRPPNTPWREIGVPGDRRGLGYLSVYLSDPLSRLAVRAVTLPLNAKSDPNLETLTYGLFSTCSQQMRTSIVRRRVEFLFFMTNRASGRVLTGYYHLRWYAEGPLHGPRRDYCLAADGARFIDPPIRVDELGGVARAAAGRRFRLAKLVDAPVANALVKALRRRPDRTADYLEEIHRLQRFNRYHTGAASPGWSASEFDWEAARPFLTKPRRGTEAAEPTRNSSPTDRWRCRRCRRVVINKALLKQCPECGAMGSLRPVER